MRDISHGKEKVFVTYGFIARSFNDNELRKQSISKKHWNHKPYKNDFGKVRTED